MGILANTRALLAPVGTMEWWKSWAQLIVGCMIMMSGMALFLDPYRILPGGVGGLGQVFHAIFPTLQVGTFGYFVEVPLLIIAFLMFGKRLGARTVVAALFCWGFLILLEKYLLYPTAEASEALDPSQLLGGSLDLSGDLLLATILGGVVVGFGQAVVVRTQATTGGIDIVAMLLQKYAGIKFSTAIFMADCVVVLSGLVVIGFGWGSASGEGAGWILSLYSLITIFLASRVIAWGLDGASYDKLLFVISDEHTELKKFIVEDLDRSATYIRARGMYTDKERDMIFLVVPRKQVHLVKRKIQEIDPRAFVVETDAYETYGEGFKPFPDANSMQAQ